MAAISEEFRSKGITRGGELLLRSIDAIDFVRCCRERHIEVLGIDAFRLTDTTTQPDMGESIDLSSLQPERHGTTNWDRAEDFLSQRVDSSLFFKVVADEC